MTGSIARECEKLFREQLRNYASIDNFGEVSPEISNYFQQFPETENEIAQQYFEVADNTFPIPEDNATALTALYVQLNERPFSLIWIAAMAMHSKLVAKDDFAFGYLCALFEQSVANSADVRAGRKATEGARQGAKERAASNATQRQATLERMRVLCEVHTVSRSAELAFKEKLGTSAEANRKLWYRNKKLGQTGQSPKK
tara:strand:- start:1028 stop:1627 length:600 start_codon:yes stop_codon:yes gene_type:complete